MKNIEKLDKSINELTGGTWHIDIPIPGETTLTILNTYEVANKRILDFDNENICFAIGQNRWLEYVVPQGICILAQDIMTECRFYPCDLLNVMLRSEREFWVSNPILHQMVLLIYFRQKERIIEGEDLGPSLRDEVFSLFDIFVTYC